MSDYSGSNDYSTMKPLFKNVYPEKGTGYKSKKKDREVRFRKIRRKLKK